MKATLTIPTISEFQEYLEKRVSSGTAQVYVYCLKKWFEFLDGDMPSASNAQDYVDYLAHTGKSASTVSLRGHAIARWFKWQGKHVELDLPVVRLNEPSYIPVGDVEKLLANCKTLIEKVLITVLFDTGLRISELLNLKVSDIDKDNGLVTVVGKGGRTEQANISDKALAVLNEWLDARQSKSNDVFMGLKYVTAWKMISNVGIRAGIKLHPHMLRHSRAVQMRKSGAALEDIKDHLRHKNIATTANIYARYKAIDLKDRIPAW